MIPTVIWETALAHPPKVCTGVQVTNVIAWMAARKFPFESHAVGIMGILVHCPVHVGSRLLSTSDLFGRVSSSLGCPRQWLSTISTLPFEMALMMPLWARGG